MTSSLIPVLLVVATIFTVFSFDIMSFDPADATSSWVYLESVAFEEVMVSA
ncbi:hypothetical protein J7M23_05395 [Candidatus Sumerlaeota bacterium]|nr:hypothetical protein [Candidatus Sumerlaeota bacterium]